jgi:hypothetical protein
LYTWNVLYGRVIEMDRMGFYLVSVEGGFGRKNLISHALGTVKWRFLCTRPTENSISKPNIRHVFQSKLSTALRLPLSFPSLPF